MQLILLHNEISPFFGRFHPLLVHLPIGFVIIGFLLEFFGRKAHKPHLLEAVNFVLWLAGFSSLFTVISGYLLSLEAGFSDKAIFLHQWMGVVVTILIFITLLFKNTKVYMLLLSSTVLGVFITGHLGGNLTHGETFLTEHLPNEIKNTFGLHKDTYVLERVTYQEASLYKHIVYPILHDKCIGCHNDSKMKGDLNMKEFTAFLKGGENGKVMVHNSAKKSEMIKRILLPEDHDDTMPPEGKERITKEELSLITFWIDEDGEKETPLDSLTISDDLKEEIEFRLLDGLIELNPVFEKNIGQASNSKLDVLKDLGFTVLPIEKESPFLQVNYFNRLRPLDQQSKKALLEISEQLVWLNLSGAKVDNSDWSFLLNLQHLNRLNLAHTNITSEVIANFPKSDFLETLSLFGTNVDKEILLPLCELKNLKALYVGNTQIHISDTLIVSDERNKFLEITF